jgi:hypothetical protein
MFLSSLSYGQDTVQVFVALWDSPADQDLYWGKLYGIKTYFQHQEGWEMRSETDTGAIIEKEAIFYNPSLNIYLKARAYTSPAIKQAITEFLQYVYEADESELVIYVGHDGLMDFRLDIAAQKHLCDVMVFSCESEPYFSPYVHMILSTYTLMAPEAYGVMAAVEAWSSGENEEMIRKITAANYAKYQRITLQSAERTFLPAY